MASLVAETARRASRRRRLRQQRCRFRRSRNALRALACGFLGVGKEKTPPPVFVLYLIKRQHKMQERQHPAKESCLSCMETVLEDSKFS